jgi:hypothetical protein
MSPFDPRPSVKGEARTARPVILSWSALWGGTLIGWATFFLLSLGGAAVGLGPVRQLVAGAGSADVIQRVGVGAGLWGLVSMLIAAFIGAYCICRLAGERRRREAFAHSGVAWGLSICALAPFSVAAATPGLLAASMALSLVVAFCGGLIATTGPLEKSLSRQVSQRRGNGQFAQPSQAQPRAEPRGDRPTIIPPTH